MKMRSVAVIKVNLAPFPVHEASFPPSCWRSNSLGYVLGGGGGVVRDWVKLHGCACAGGSRVVREWVCSTPYPLASYPTCRRSSACAEGGGGKGWGGGYGVGQLNPSPTSHLAQKAIECTLYSAHNWKETMARQNVVFAIWGTNWMLHWIFRRKFYFDL